MQKLVKGFEPPTYGLQIRCSTVELHQLYFLLIKIDLKYLTIKGNFNKFDFFTIHNQIILLNK